MLRTRRKAQRAQRVVSQFEGWIGWTRSAHGDMRNAYKILTENLKERDHLDHLDVDGRIIL